MIRLVIAIILFAFPAQAQLGLYNGGLPQHMRSAGHSYNNSDDENEVIAGYMGFDFSTSPWWWISANGGAAHYNGSGYPIVDQCTSATSYSSCIDGINQIVQVDSSCRFPLSGGPYRHNISGATCLSDLSASIGLLPTERICIIDFMINDLAGAASSPPSTAATQWNTNYRPTALTALDNILDSFESFGYRCILVSDTPYMGSGTQDNEVRINRNAQLESWSSYIENTYLRQASRSQHVLADVWTEYTQLRQNYGDTAFFELYSDCNTPIPTSCSGSTCTDIPADCSDGNHPGGAVGSLGFSGRDLRAQVIERAVGKLKQSIRNKWIRGEGLQTNPGEIDRGSSAVWGSQLNSIRGHATTARDSWPWLLIAEDYTGNSSTCRPSSISASDPTADDYDLTDIGSDIFAMALMGRIDSDDTFYDASRMRLLQVTTITDLDSSVLSGGNQCILDSSALIRSITEASWFMEAAGYKGWTASDKQTLANWMATEVFPLADWAATHRKNNWGASGLSSAYEVAIYSLGGIDSLTRWDGSAIATATYIDTTSTNDLGVWLSDTAGNEMDSDCATAAEPFGQQNSGSFPDDVRRTGGTTNCGQTDLTFACGVTPNASCATGGSAAAYHQKSTNLITRLFESKRRFEGNGDTGFDLTNPGGTSTRAVDAFEFGTTIPGYADYQGIGVGDTTQGAKNVIGQYVQNRCILNALDDGTVYARGGRDHPYTVITHADGVAYTAIPPTCP